MYVLDGTTARFRELRTGISDGERVEIVDPLAEGTRVVTIGALALRDGDRVAVATEDAGRAAGANGL